MDLKKIIKYVVAALAIIACLMQFLPQVTVTLLTGDMSIGVQTLYGGDIEFKSGLVTTLNSNPVIIVGYYLVLLAGLLFAVTAVSSYFKEHGTLNLVVIVFALICLLLGLIFIFTLKTSFNDYQALTTNSDNVKLAAGSVIAGILASVAFLGGVVAFIIDLNK